MCRGIDLCIIFRFVDRTAILSEISHTSNIFSRRLLYGHSTLYILLYYQSSRIHYYWFFRLNVPSPTFYLSYANYIPFYFSQRVFEFTKSVLHLLTLGIFSLQYLGCGVNYTSSWTWNSLPQFPQMFYIFLPSTPPPETGGSTLWTSCSVVSTYHIGVRCWNYKTVIIENLGSQKGPVAYGDRVVR